MKAVERTVFATPFFKLYEATSRTPRQRIQKLRQGFFSNKMFCSPSSLEYHWQVKIVRNKTNYFYLIKRPRAWVRIYRQHASSFTEEAEESTRSPAYMHPFWGDAFVTGSDGMWSHEKGNNNLHDTGFSKCFSTTKKTKLLFSRTS